MPPTGAEGQVGAEAILSVMWTVGPPQDDRLGEVATTFDLALVVLFGSRATGHSRPDSDSDVGILRWQGVVSAEHFPALGLGLARATGLPDIDLVDLRRAPALLRYRAARDGRPLFEAAPALFTRFHVQAWKQYLDDEYDFRRLDVRYLRESLAGFDRAHRGAQAR